MLLAPLFARKARICKSREDADMFGPTLVVAAGGDRRVGRPRLTIRLMVVLLYLMHVFNLSDESVVERWSENFVKRHGVQPKQAALRRRAIWALPAGAGRSRC